MPTARYSLGVAAGPDGRIYAIGGVVFGENRAFDVVEAYSPASNSWEVVAPLPSPRALVNAVAAADGRIYVIGGCEFDSEGPEGLCLDSKRVDVYSVQTNSWQTVEPTIFGHVQGATVVSGKCIYVIGGFITGVGISAAVESAMAK
jgi:N-acetylneuraminic acid mutarotase